MPCLQLCIDLSRLLMHACTPKPPTGRRQMGFSNSLAATAAPAQQIDDEIKNAIAGEDKDIYPGGESWPPENSE